MKPKSFYTFASMFVLALLVVLLSSASGAVAQKPTPADGMISYSGRLSNDASQPVTDGMYAFTFALYDAANDGNLLWSETQTGVAVQGGAFTVVLGSVTPLPQQARVSQGWLAVGVRGPGETDFTLLSPRQVLNAASAAAPSSPAAGAACAHDHFGEMWAGNSAGGLDSAGLKVQTSTSDDIGIFGKADWGANALGVYGESWHGNGVKGSGSEGKGVYGVTDTGAGVYGEAWLVSGSGGSAGVVAYHHNTTGTALNIKNGAFRVEGAGVGSTTTVFVHRAKTGVGGNICPAYPGATVIDHPLVNNDISAILIVTLNGGMLGSGVGPADPRISVQWDLFNVCGFGARWVIFDNSGPMPDGTEFNVLVVKP